MIRGYFSTRGGISRPYVTARFQFPSLENRTLETRLLVDTGADRTLLAPRDCKRLIRRFGLDLTSLATTATGTGIGGKVNMRARSCADFATLFDCAHPHRTSTGTRKHTSDPLFAWTRCAFSLCTLHGRTHRASVTTGRARGSSSRWGHLYLPIDQI